jgi:hypothetical protein
VVIVGAKSLPTPAPARTDNAIIDDIASFWDELDSSTQIARDLSYEAPKLASSRVALVDNRLKNNIMVTKTNPQMRRVSFSSSSGSFDLTAEDLDILDVTEVDKPQGPRTTSPALRKDAFVKSYAMQGGTAKLRGVGQDSPKFSPTTHRYDSHTRPTAKPLRHPVAAQQPKPRVDHAPERGPTNLIGGFSATQLESLIDDDLQLTQMELG